MRCSRAGLCVVLLLVLLSTAMSRAAEAVVNRVELRSDVELERPDELFSGIAVEVGQPLDRKAVARSLRNLRAAGIAGQVEAHLLSGAMGEQITFVLRGRTLVEEVRLLGDLGLKRWRVREAVTVRKGRPFLADEVFRSFLQLRELYDLNGYLDASVRVRVDEDEERRRASVSFEIDPGEPAVIGEIDFEGDLGSLTATALREVVDSESGGRYGSLRLREDQEALETWLLRQGYRQATVGLPIELRQGTSRVDVRFPVELGHHFTVEVAGDSSVLRKRGLIPLDGSERYDGATLFDAKSRIRSDFQQRGHYEVAVQIDETIEGREHRLLVSVDPGPQNSLVSVSFLGNENLADGRLQSVMRTTVRARFTALSGVLVDLWLEGDLAALRGVYALEGFLEAQIGPAEIEIRPDGDLAVVIPVAEGSRTTIEGVELHGAEAMDAEDLLGSLPLTVGGPYHSRRLENALAQIRARYANAGFNQAHVTAHLDWSDDLTSVDVHVHLLEGPQSLSERVVVHGQQKTRQSFIRNVIDLQPGTPLSPRVLRDTQRRLYKQGIFSAVDVRVIYGSPFSPGRDVIVQVEEGRNRRVTYGFGYDTEDGLRGLFGYSHRNLWGRGVSGQLDVRASERDRLIRAFIQQPLVGQWDLPVTYSLFVIDEAEESFRSQRRGGQVDINRVNGRTRWGMTYTYKVVELADADPALEQLLIDREFQEVTVASLGPSVSFDHRDDALDPQRGWNTSIVTEYAFPMAKAEEEFFKLFLQFSKLFPLGSAGVVVANARIGGIEPLVEPTEVDPVCEENGLDFASCDVKISERFFAGGRASHRAYRLDRLGIPGQTLLEVEGQEDLVAFGGTGLLLFNLDYRFPIFGDIGGTLFADAGNLWPDWRDIDTGELKLGVGVGLRYASPFGPVRLEVGWKLDRLTGEDPYVVLFSVGNAF